MRLRTPRRPGLTVPKPIPIFRTSYHYPGSVPLALRVIRAAARAIRVSEYSRRALSFARTSSGRRGCGSTSPSATTRACSAGSSSRAKRRKPWPASASRNRTTDVQCRLPADARGFIYSWWATKRFRLTEGRTNFALTQREQNDQTFRAGLSSRI
jgi:hypothetical protein